MNLSTVLPWPIGRGGDAQKLASYRVWQWPHGPADAAPGRPKSPSRPPVRRRRQHLCRGSELIEAGHRDGTAELGLQGAEVVEGVDALAEVGRDLTEADFQCFDDRLAGLSQ